MARQTGNNPFSGNFEVQKSSPFDSRGVVDYLSDLTSLESWKAPDGTAYTYRGLLTCVVNDSDINNGLYRLKTNPPTDLNNWEKIESSGTPSGDGSFYQRSFTNDELTDSKIIITHGLGGSFFTYTAFNNLNEQILPNNVTIVDANSFELDLTNISPIEGSYTIFVLTRGGGEAGTTDYAALENKPQINGVELSGNKTSDLFNLVGSFNKSVTNVQVMTQAQYDATPAFAKGYMIYIVEDGETSYRKIIFFNETNVPTIVYDSTNLAGSSVLYTAQTLTDEQKAQAQTNIDAQSASTSTFQNDKLERAILFPYDFEQLGVEIPTISKAIKGLYLTNYDFAKDYYLNVVQMDNGAGNARIRIISRLKAMFLTTATELEILAPISDTTSDLEIKYEDTEGRGIVLINWGELPENYNMTGMSGGYKLDLSIFSKNNPLAPKKDEIFIIPNEFLDLPNNATYEQMFAALGVTTENEITAIINSWCSYKTFLRETQNPDDGEISRLFLDVKTTTIEDGTTFEGDAAYAPDFKVTMNDGVNITNIRMLRNTGLWQFTKTVEPAPQYAEKSSQVEESSATPILDLVDNTDYILITPITSLTINSVTGTGSIEFATADSFINSDFTYPDNTVFNNVSVLEPSKIYIAVYTSNKLIISRGA